MSTNDLFDRLFADFLAAEARCESPDRNALLATHPDLANRLRSFFADHDRMRGLAELTGAYRPEPDGGSALKLIKPVL